MEGVYTLRNLELQSSQQHLLISDTWNTGTPLREKFETNPTKQNSDRNTTGVKKLLVQVLFGR